MYNLIKKSLRFYWKQNLSVLLGTIISTAVLTGALIVGDSVRLSLQKLVEVRLGKTRFALQTGDRFISSALADKISETIGVDAESLLILNGIAINPEAESRINGVQILGIDSSFWRLSYSKPLAINNDEVVISSNLADRLNLKPGDEILLRVENITPVPRNSPFVQESAPSIAFRMIIRDIAHDDQMGRFSLKSNQVAPYNVFIQIGLLSQKLGLEGKANSILVAESDNQNLDQVILNSVLNQSWRFKDAGVQVRPLSKSNGYELISERIIIDQPMVSALDSMQINYQPVLTYLSNTIESAHGTTPYSFVSAMNPSLNDLEIMQNEILVNQWLANDLKVKQGDSVSLSYFTVGPLRKLVENTVDFKIIGIIPIKTSNVDETLMPLFPGFADAGSCHDWSADIPIDWNRIRKKDEQYWNEFRGTPKAIISINDGTELWANRYGRYTALRFSNADVTSEKLETLLMKSIRPSDIGLYFSPVYELGETAATNSVDFGELFLSLSFFVISAGILLTSLIYSLNTSLRSEEIGVLAAIGFSKSLIIKVRTYESIVIAFIGGALGAILGIFYNQILISGLNTVWIGAVRTSNLDMFVKPGTLIIGAFSGVIISILSIYLVVRRNLKQPVSYLIRKESIVLKGSISDRLIRFMGLALVIVALVLVVVSTFRSGEINANAFLSAGGMFMAGSIVLVYMFLGKDSKYQHPEKTGLTRLAIRNSTRNFKRSISVISLLALGTFTIIITGANRKTFYGVEKSNSSGTGGYSYWAETTLPVNYDLNSTEGRAKVGLEGDLPEVRFIQFHSLDGDDASCLNLNLVQQPRILSVDPDEFNNRKAFSFAKVMDGLDKVQPWLNLKKSFSDHMIPAVVDQTVLTWGLKKAVGDTLYYLNEKGERVGLLVVGGLNNSIFQGNILIADSLFLQNFPSSSGSKLMLVDASDKTNDQVENILSNNLTDYGLEITPTSVRLAEFNSVTNTYLTVFMVLGGLGVIIGTLGLGIVLVRNMLERRSEIALLLAIGYNRSNIFMMILIENIYLLLAGIIIGMVSALIGILPSAISPALEMPSGFMFTLILIVFLSGLVSIYLPSRAAVQGNIIKGLREE